MSGFLSEARSSAAREFGARHYRAFAAVAVARRAAPAAGAVLAIAGVFVGAAWLSKVAPGWWVDARPWAPTALGWLIAAAAVTAVVAASVWVWRNRWRWW